MPERVTIAVDPGTIDCGLAVLTNGKAQHHTPFYPVLWPCY